ncbi:MAG: BolA family transcriptional regulator [Myxococcota bacterium]|nr:BolA family transcriptional regulator [Myxococcota bacterium]
MALKLVGAQDDAAERLRTAIRAALPGAEVEVRTRGAGHFELRVVAAAFRERSRLQQHQLVYGAIASLMAGDAPPVHAIDRLVTEAPVT